jgi:hypothetical protein
LFRKDEYPGSKKLKLLAVSGLKNGQTGLIPFSEGKVFPAGKSRKGGGVFEWRE